MRRMLVFLVLGLGLGLGCSRTAPTDSFVTGSDITVNQKDGTLVTGRLVDVTPETLVVEQKAGLRTIVPRDQVASVTLIPAAPAKTSEIASSAGSGAQLPSQAVPTPPFEAAGGEASKPSNALPAAAVTPTWRELTIPAGSILRVRLDTTVGSDISRVEAPVRGTLTEPVTINGREALEPGSTLAGTVIEARRSGRVEGRARVALRFDSITVDDERMDIQTEPVSRTAPGTKKKDATKIGIGTAAGAIIGGIVGGGKGAAIGAGTGAGAGTAVVMSTRGAEVQIPQGTPLTVKLTEPLRVRVKV